jgi:hypothetical protein
MGLSSSAVQAVLSSWSDHVVQLPVAARHMCRAGGRAWWCCMAAHSSRSCAEVAAMSGGWSFWQVVTGAAAERGNLTCMDVTYRTHAYLSATPDIALQTWFSYLGPCSFVHKQGSSVKHS